MKENRLLFTNALIVLPTETIKGSLAVEDGKITGIFESGTELPGFTEVDVHGKALMPGAIDTHVHMWDPSPLNYREDWACGSQCAASGGITTIIHELVEKFLNAETTIIFLNTKSIFVIILLYYRLSVQK